MSILEGDLTEKERGPRKSLAAHLELARFDHWVKNVFVLPGLVVALSVGLPRGWSLFVVRLVTGLLSAGLIASSNYILNEVLDGPTDRHHPTKHLRPVPSGRVSIPWAYAQWLMFMAAGLALAAYVSAPFLYTMIALWAMGCLYNIPPIRLKDKPYLDVLSESVNNPLRMLAGWYIASATLPPPGSLLMSYWMIGCYFMAIKRYAEYREIGGGEVITAYRRSFGFYNERRLLVSITFYGSFAMLTLGTFIARYRLELIIAYPLFALVMGLYLNLAFDQHSAAQAPERLYREPSLMIAAISCALLVTFLLFVRVQWLQDFVNLLHSPLPAGR